MVFTLHYHPNVVITHESVSTRVKQREKCYYSSPLLLSQTVSSVSINIRWSGLSPPPALVTDYTSCSLKLATFRPRPLSCPALICSNVTGHYYTFPHLIITIHITVYITRLISTAAECLPKNNSNLRPGRECLRPSDPRLTVGLMMMRLMNKFVLLWWLFMMITCVSQVTRSVANSVLSFPCFRISWETGLGSSSLQSTLFRFYWVGQVSSQTVHWALQEQVQVDCSSSPGGGSLVSSSHQDGVRALQCSPPAGHCVSSVPPVDLQEPCSACRSSSPAGPSHCSVAGG